jgi:hypothetical protein
MSMFGERFLIAVFVGLFVALVINPMNLDLTQRITGGVALVCVALFVGHTIQIHNKKSPSVPSPTVEALYSVTWDLGVSSSKINRTTGSSFWIRQDHVANTEDALLPANLSAYLTIVSHRNVPVLIKEYSVEVRAQDGSFVRFNELPILPGRTAYAGVESNKLGKIEDNSLFLNKAVDGHTLEPLGSVRGLALFQVPAEDNRTFEPVIKLTILDYRGSTFTTEPLESHERGTAQSITIAVGDHFDLSRLPLRFVDRYGTLVPPKW